MESSTQVSNNDSLHEYLCQVKLKVLELHLTGHLLKIKYPENLEYLKDCFIKRMMAAVSGRYPISFDHAAFAKYLTTFQLVAIGEVNSLGVKETECPVKSALDLVLYFQKIRGVFSRSLGICPSEQPASFLIESQQVICAELQKLADSQDSTPVIRRLVQAQVNAISASVDHDLAEIPLQAENLKAIYKSLCKAKFGAIILDVRGVDLPIMMGYFNSIWSDLSKRYRLPFNEQVFRENMDALLNQKESDDDALNCDPFGPECWEKKALDCALKFRKALIQFRYSPNVPLNMRLVFFASSAFAVVTDLACIKCKIPEASDRAFIETYTRFLDEFAKKESEK